MFYVVNFDNEKTMRDEFRSRWGCLNHAESINSNRCYTIEANGSEDKYVRKDVN